MEKRKIQVVESELFFQDLQALFDYGVETFGLNASDAFVEDLLFRVENLAFQYELHPECRFLVTKKRIYRNIILGSYMILYRIKTNRIEVLRIFHSSSSIRRIKQARSIKI